MTNFIPRICQRSMVLVLDVIREVAVCEGIYLITPLHIIERATYSNTRSTLLLLLLVLNLPTAAIRVRKRPKVESKPNLPGSCNVITKPLYLQASKVCAGCFSMAPPNVV
jgi:hypothetical protein